MKKIKGLREKLEGECSQLLLFQCTTTNGVHVATTAYLGIAQPKRSGALRDLVVLVFVCRIDIVS